MSLEGYKILLDPGHNETHTGANYNNLKEHEVVLDIAKACRDRLIALGEGVSMSRTDHIALSSDYPTDLDLRVSKSNSFGANIFVSIHNNASGTLSANGVETYVRTGASTYVKSLAANVNSLVASRTGMSERNPAVKEYNFRVINTGDAAKLNTLAERNTAGIAIADGINNFAASLPPIY